MFQKTATLIIALLFTVCLSVPTLAFTLPDTGQTKCYQTVSPYDEISCAGTGQDGAYNANPVSYSDNGDGTVTDDVTGLMWQKEDDNQNYNWYQASGIYEPNYNPSSMNVCGSLNLGGYSDWRLPSKKELMGIVDYSIPSPGPTLDQAIFPNTNAKVNDIYWSHTSYTGSSNNEAWRISFHDATVKADVKSNNLNTYVRCVRGVEEAASLADNGNDTVTDKRTELTWQQGEPGQMTWGSAITYCEGLNLGGRTDWRLPDVKELESLSDDIWTAPVMDPYYFPDANGTDYWTSTTDSDDTSRTWAVNFNDGLVGDRGLSAKDGLSNVRCVTGGNSRLFGNVNISFSGSGGGTVNGSGIRDAVQAVFSDKNDSSEQFDMGTTVSLSVTPDAYSYFSGWTGACSGTGSCDLNINARNYVTAVFKLRIPYKLADSGETKCYQTVSPYAEISCAGTGQDGAFSINPMAYVDNGNGTVTDKVTGLMWQQEDDSQNYNWYQAEGIYEPSYNPTAENVCGALDLGGYSDWRLPSIKELVSIVDFSSPSIGPTLNNTYFPNTKTTGGGYYWSSSSWSSSAALSVEFGNYGMVSHVLKGVGRYVRCVRGGQESASLIDNGNRTVTDNRTGLTWQQDEPGAMAWGTALSYCGELSLGGHSDWRLPNIKELESLTDDMRVGPAIDPSLFPDAAWSYLSSSTFVPIPSYAWNVNFVDGLINYIGPKAVSFNKVRCVRGKSSVKPHIISIIDLMLLD